MEIGSYMIFTMYVHVWGDRTIVNMHFELLRSGQEFTIVNGWRA